MGPCSSPSIPKEQRSFAHPCQQARHGQICLPVLNVQIFRKMAPSFAMAQGSCKAGSLSAPPPPTHGVPALPNFLTLLKKLPCKAFAHGVPSAWSILPSLFLHPLTPSLIPVASLSPVPPQTSWGPSLVQLCFLMTVAVMTIIIAMVHQAPPVCLADAE